MYTFNHWGRENRLKILKLIVIGIEAVFGNFCLYIMPYNVIMTLKLCRDWGIPHLLVIGWERVSLTPILGTLTKAEPNSIFFLAFWFFLYHALIFRFVIYNWVRVVTNPNLVSHVWEVYNILIVRCAWALSVFMGGNVYLFLIVMGNNWGLAPMAFVLGMNDVSLCPLFVPPRT